LVAPVGFNRRFSNFILFLNYEEPLMDHVVTKQFFLEQATAFFDDL